MTAGTDVTPDVLAEALAGDRAAVRKIVAAMTPIIGARVARGLARRRPVAENRDLRQEVEDLTQDVFAALFAHDGRALRAWAPERGLSLANFVGLVADRQVSTILRSGRRNPWRDVPEELDAIERATDAVPGAASQVESRQQLERLLDRLREALSPRGLELFHRLYVNEEPVDEVAKRFGMTRDAIYAWRNRVGKLLGQFATEDALDGDGSARTPLGSTKNE